MEQIGALVADTGMRFLRAPVLADPPLRRFHPFRRRLTARSHPSEFDNAAGTGAGKERSEGQLNAATHTPCIIDT